MSDYYTKYYYSSCSDKTDEIQVSKDTNTNWCDIRMITNDSNNGMITIRSKGQAQQLHFMLGQMIGDSI